MKLYAILAAMILFWLYQLGLQPVDAVTIDTPVEIIAAPNITPQNNIDARQTVINIALQQLGKPYVLGDEGPDTFDCSGLVQYAYHQIGIETTRTTFTQLDALQPIQVSELQIGDMVYFQYPWDQHTGILADLNNDGKFDMIHAASPEYGVIVDYDVFSIPFYTDAIIGYRTAL